MTTKGLTLSPETRAKISLSKTKHTEASLTAGGVSYLDSILNPDPNKTVPIPTVVGLCLHCGISRSRLYELLPSMPKVADIVEYIEMLQEQFAINEGFRGKASIFSMFLLKSKHNYHDSPQQLTQNNYMNISPDLLADALAIMNEDKKTAKQIK